MTDRKFTVRDQRKPNHHWADNEVLDDFGVKIGPFGYAVYMFICRHAGNRDGRCTKSQGDIARTFGMSTDTVQRAIEKLIALNLVAKEKRVDNSCIYLVLEVPKHLPLTAASLTAHSGKPTGTPLPLTAATLPLTAEALPPTAASNKEVRLSQDFIKTKTTCNSASELPEFQLSPPKAEKPKPESAADPRYQPLVEVIEKLWPKGVEIPFTFDGADGAALNRLLNGRAKKLSWQKIAICIAFRFLSATENTTESVKAWIGSVLDFASGPHDDFNHPPQSQDLEYWTKQARTILWGDLPEQDQLPIERGISKFDDLNNLPKLVNGNEAREAWANTLGQLETKINRHSFETWLKPTKALGIERQKRQTKSNASVTVSTLHVRVPTFEFKHIREKYALVIRDSLPTWISGIELWCFDSSGREAAKT